MSQDVRTTQTTISETSETSGTYACTRQSELLSASQRLSAGCAALLRFRVLLADPAHTVVTKAGRRDALTRTVDLVPFRAALVSISREHLNAVRRTNIARSMPAKATGLLHEWGACADRDLYVM